MSDDYQERLDEMRKAEKEKGILPGMAEHVEKQGKELSAKDARNTIRLVMTAERAVATVKSRATELERLVLGEPTQIVKHTVAPAPATVPEVEAEIEAAQRALEMARESDAAGAN